MATATRERTALAVEHIRGCPVAANPGDEGLAARVETYRTVRPARQVQQDGFPLTYPAQVVTVAHCCECGAMTYSEES